MLKKLVYLITLLICSVSGLMLFSSCTKNPEAPSVMDSKSTLSSNSTPTISKASTFAELRTHFEALTLKMAQQAPQVIEKMLASDKMLEAKLEVGFDELDLNSDFARNFLSPEGLLLRTTLERAKPSKINPKSKNASIIFAPDPDRFQPEEQEHTCVGWLVQNGEAQSVEFTKEEYEANFSNIPLYMVGFQEVREPAAAKSSIPSSKIQSSSPYASCFQIKIIKNSEGWTNHETEVYLKIPDELAYQGETIHKFDGTSRTDSSGRNVYYPDINDTGTWYNVVDEVALFALDSQNRGWVAIEDDYGTGYHIRKENPGGCQNGLPCTVVFSTDVQFADGSAVWDVSREYFFILNTGINNQDDLWDSGAYENFTSSWSHSGPYDWYELVHNGFRMKRNNY